MDRLKLLFDSCSSGDLLTVKELLDSNIDVDRSNANNVTALQVASANGHDTIVKYLIMKGAALEKCNTKKWTPLLQASRHGHSNVVKTLLQHQANVNAKTRLGISAMLLVSKKGDVETCKLLKNAGIDLASSMNSGPYYPDCDITPVMVACFYGHEELVKFFMKIGEDINQRSMSLGISCLMLAALGGHEGIVKLLVENGANPNLTDINGRSALEFAMVRNHKKIQMYLSRITNVNSNTVIEDMKSDILEAIKKGNLQQVREILDNDISQRDATQPEDGATALMFATMLGRLDIVQELVERGCDVNKQDLLSGWTALMQAVYHGKKSIAKYLINSGADVHVRAKYDCNALDMVVLLDNIDTELYRMLASATISTPEVSEGSKNNLSTSRGTSFSSHFTINSSTNSKSHLKFWWGKMSDRFRHLKIGSTLGSHKSGTKADIDNFNNNNNNNNNNDNNNINNDNNNNENIISINVIDFNSNNNNSVHSNNNFNNNNTISKNHNSNLTNKNYKLISTSFSSLKNALVSNKRIKSSKSPGGNILRMTAYNNDDMSIVNKQYNTLPTSELKGVVKQSSMPTSSNNNNNNSNNNNNWFNNNNNNNNLSPIKVLDSPLSASSNDEEFIGIKNPLFVTMGSMNIPITSTAGNNTPIGSTLKPNVPLFLPPPNFNNESHFKMPQPRNSVPRLSSMMGDDDNGGVKKVLHDIGIDNVDTDSINNNNDYDDGGDNGGVDDLLYKDNCGFYGNRVGNNNIKSRDKPFSAPSSGHKLNAHSKLKSTPKEKLINRYIKHSRTTTTTPPTNHQSNHHNHQSPTSPTDKTTTTTTTPSSSSSSSTTNVSPSTSSETEELRRGLMMTSQTRHKVKHSLERSKVGSSASSSTGTLTAGSESLDRFSDNTKMQYSESSTLVDYDMTMPSSPYLQPITAQLPDETDQQDKSAHVTVGQSETPLHNDESEDLNAVLEKCSLAKYQSVFEEQEVDMEAFLVLTESNLKELGINDKETRWKLLTIINDINQSKQTTC